MKTLTNKQMEILSPYEDRMRTAKYSHYCRMLMEKDLRKMYDILVEVTGTNTTFNANCQGCIFDIVVRVADLYFYTKEQKATHKVGKAKSAMRKGKTKIIA